VGSANVLFLYLEGDVKDGETIKNNRLSVRDKGKEKRGKGNMIKYWKGFGNNWVRKGERVGEGSWKEGDGEHITGSKSYMYGGDVVRHGGVKN